MVLMVMVHAAASWHLASSWHIYVSCHRCIFGTSPWKKCWLSSQVKCLGGCDVHSTLNNKTIGAEQEIYLMLYPVFSTYLNTKSTRVGHSKSDLMCIQAFYLNNIRTRGLQEVYIKLYFNVIHNLTNRYISLKHVVLKMMYLSVLHSEYSTSREDHNL